MDTADNRPRLVDYRGNGDKAIPTFSTTEMQRRQDNIRAIMAAASIDACLFTSYHSICYLADFLYCQFGRKYGFIVTPGTATSVSAAIDGGQPWRRTCGDNLTYTDWSRENYFHAVMVPHGQPGAGGYREHDILVITPEGNRNITGFPYGPAHNIIG